MTYPTPTLPSHWQRSLAVAVAQTATARGGGLGLRLGLRLYTCYVCIVGWYVGSLVHSFVRLVRCFVAFALAFGWACTLKDTKTSVTL